MTGFMSSFRFCYNEKKKGTDNMASDNNCTTCLYYLYDDEYEEYICDMDMDEDEYVRLISDSHYECPYYRNGDEYRVVRKQM